MLINARSHVNENETINEANEGTIAAEDTETTVPPLPVKISGQTMKTIRRRKSRTNVKETHQQNNNQMLLPNQCVNCQFLSHYLKR